MTHPAVFRPLQARFLTIPQAPLCYWLREKFFDVLSGPSLGEVAFTTRQIDTCNNNRFLRFVWEVARKGTRWLPYLKAGGYGRWIGFDQTLLDWGADGNRLKQSLIERFPYLNGNWGWLVKEPSFFKVGWTYTLVARGCLGVRHLDGEHVCDSASPTIIPERSMPGLGPLLNCRLASYLLRMTSTDIKFREGYVARIPLPARIPDFLASFESACGPLKRHLVSLDPTERTFGGIPVNGGSLAEAWRKLSDEAEAVAAVLHTLEGLSEREVFAAYGIDGEDLQAVLDETGTPAGWFPLIAGYDGIPELPQGLEVPADVIAPLANEPRRTLSPQELADLKRRLRVLYEAGPGAKVENDEEAVAENDEEESETVVSGAHIPIPAETFLEELSQKLEVHPISVYWLLRQLREKDRVVCQPELRRFAEDYVSLTVLRLLGHRWPRQIESGEPAPDWADKDGIIPLTEGTGEPTLLERVRQRIAEDFGPARVNAIEREFEQITGKRLAAWLAREFFVRHISQFKKRPIAWQIESTSSPEKRGRRGRTGDAPAFSCLVYYHRLDADLLPKLRSQYVGPLRARMRTELAGLERIEKRSADQDARRVQLERQLEELKEFDARLEQVVTRGFLCPALEAVAKKEPLDRWTSRDDESAPPATPEAFLAQEQKYDPDLNDGVRVNIAPLQRAGLLASDVLAARDVEKAISDRAQWRADERRWCREGKLPRPGWWPTRESATSAWTKEVSQR